MGVRHLAHILGRSQGQVNEDSEDRRRQTKTDCLQASVGVTCEIINLVLLPYASRVRTEFRLRPPEPINQSLLESGGPTLLCNQVK
jgi:hypothetical protein